ncbi:acetate--CoA ligase [Dongshaea marina]|uniref:acetate--CoA ligase n=1 Tax=Dongshaea marina TaxID=2047966 RepID=UPI000D3EDF90|nr:acetate--CoA ligase [Dongshaea marina]
MERYPVPERVRNRAYINSEGYYQERYRYSIENNEDFWENLAYSKLKWINPFSKVKSEKSSRGLYSWFLDGKINACYNCVDRHLEERGYQTAIIWEGNEPDEVRSISYYELHQDICRLANALKRKGIRKGDSVAIYMPMIPEAIIAMLACARIGAIHTVIFAGFSSKALAQRVNSANANLLITANEGVRGVKRIPLKEIVDEALSECPQVHSVLVAHRTSSEVKMLSGRDYSLDKLMDTERPYCPCEEMDSEDPLFILYTSGSTGIPKGIMHTTAGYLLYAAVTHQYIFDYHPGDVYACVADLGWITGHSYVVYGPLANGASTLMFESLPTYPDPGRYWDMVERHKVNIFYTSPTALRNLNKHGDLWVNSYDRSSLRVLGSVGEPIDQETWKWYHEIVGEGRCAVVDTWWQTECGGIMMSPLPGVSENKPGSVHHPFFGIEPIILDEDGKALLGNDVHGELVIRQSWPGIARSIYGDHRRFIELYCKTHPGLFYTGDGVYRDKDGYYWVTGRIDDVLNVSGHRIGSGEIENALTQHPACVESSVIGVPDPIKGQGIYAFVILKESDSDRGDITSELKGYVCNIIGPFAKPDNIIIVPELPKTRSGKIMRRLLRHIATCNLDGVGDLSTLNNPDAIKEIASIFNNSEQLLDVMN